MRGGRGEKAHGKDLDDGRTFGGIGGDNDRDGLKFPNGLHVVRDARASFDGLDAFEDWSVLAEALHPLLALLLLVGRRPSVSLGVSRRADNIVVRIIVVKEGTFGLNRLR